MNINLDIKKIDEINKEGYDELKEILSAAHHLHKYTMQATEVENALKSENKDKTIATLTKKIAKYEKLINSLTFITGRHVEYIPNYYEDKSLDEIKSDLLFIRNIIMVDVIKDYGLEKIAEKALTTISNKYNAREENKND